MLKVELINDLTKLDKQIKALESLIATDNPKDKQIHLQAIKDLREHRKLLSKGDE